ncbi:hypothetical protein J2W46_003307 [Paraburkholderia strydomiana]|nr:hypothetical protein [Paraburkholderia strydomiana]
MRSRLGHHLTSCAVRVAGLYHELRQGYLGLPGLLRGDVYLWLL